MKDSKKCKNLWRKKTASWLHNFTGRVKNWNHRVTALLFFLLSSFQKQPPKIFLKVAVLKFHKLPRKIPEVDFCFSCRAQTFVSTETKLLRSMLSLEFWSSYSLEYLWLIAAPKSSHWRCSIKILFLKTFHYSQENTCAGVSFW